MLCLGYICVMGGVGACAMPSRRASAAAGTRAGSLTALAKIVDVLFTLVRVHFKFYIKELWGEFLNGETFHKPEVLGFSGVWPILNPLAPSRLSTTCCCFPLCSAPPIFSTECFAEIFCELLVWDTNESFLQVLTPDLVGFDSEMMCGAGCCHCVEALYQPKTLST